MERFPRVHQGWDDERVFRPLLRATRIDAQDGRRSLSMGSRQDGTGPELEDLFDELAASHSPFAHPYSWAGLEAVGDI